jgi:O-antigen ligase
MAIYMFADHPVLGVGAMNYREWYPDYIREYGSPVDDVERNAHSFYLEIAAEHGLVGLIVWGGALVMAWSRMRLAQRLFEAAGNVRMATLAMALRIGFIGYLVTAIFYHGSYPRYLWLQVALAVALAVAARRYAAWSEQQQDEQGPDEARGAAAIS